MIITQRKKVLCDAIARHFVVHLKYDDDLFWRIFEPQAVYKSTVDKINVTGVQTQDKNKPLELPSRKPRNFELDRIKFIEVTDIHFKFDPTFDRYDKRFTNGIFCCIKPMKIGN